MKNALFYKFLTHQNALFYIFQKIRTPYFTSLGVFRTPYFTYFSILQVAAFFLTNYLNAKEDFENLLTIITEYPIYIKVFR